MDGLPKNGIDTTAVGGQHRRTATELMRRLSLLDSIAIVVGIMIGGGIFLVPNLVARSLPSVTMITGVWVLAGVISYIGALACAELGGALPATGGQYVFLREAYGSPARFSAVGLFSTVARSAQVAWLAVVFAIYISYWLPLAPPVAKLLSLAVLAIFTLVNYRGVRFGAIVQNGFTLAKVAGILIIISSAWLLAPKTSPHAAMAVPGVSFGSFGVTLIACVLSYDRWVQLSFVAGEIRNPQRNIMRALTMGTLAVTTRAPSGILGGRGPTKLGRRHRIQSRLGCWSWPWCRWHSAQSSRL